MKIPISVFFLLLLGLASLRAGTPYLSLTLDLDYSTLNFVSMNKMTEKGRVLPSGDLGKAYEKIREKGVKMLLEEAQWIFSGMIYGFNFRYVPGNLNSGPGPEFSLELRHSIRRGDDGLVPYQVEDNLDRLRVLFYYWPDEYEQNRLSLSREGLYRAAAGEGAVPFMEEGARLSCLKEGIKKALRNDLRQQYYNRPLEVGGILFFSGPPWIGIRAGEYRGLVRILYKTKILTNFPAKAFPG